MAKEIVIKNCIFFDDYKFDERNGQILIIGTGEKKNLENKKINGQQLVESTLELGEKINNYLYDYYIKVGEFDIDEDPDKAKTKTRYEKTNINQAVLKYVDDFTSKQNKHPSEYISFAKLYGNSYNLLKNRINEQKILNPSDFDGEARDAELMKLGIINPKNYDNIINDLDNSVKKINKLLKENTKKINYISLVKYTNYTPDGIDRKIVNLIKLIRKDKMKKTVETNLIKNVFNSIKKYCKKYGMPLWTEREDIAEITYHNIAIRENSNIGFFDEFISVPCEEYDHPPLSEYESANQTIPANNLIYISILMYLSYTLWKDLFTKNIKQIEPLINYYTLFIGAFWLEKNKIEVYDIYKSKDEFFNKVEDMDDFIKTKCNSIYDFPLKKYTRKIPNRSNSICDYHNEDVYESTAFAAWETFYLDFLGNKNIEKPVSCKCGALVNEESMHKTGGEKVCEKCYKKIEKILNKERVKRCRNKKHIA